MSATETISLWDAPNNFFENGNINKEAVNREIQFPVYIVSNYNTKVVMKIYNRFCPALMGFDKFVPIEDNDTKQGIVLDPTLFSNILKELSEKEKITLQMLNEEITADKIIYMNKKLTYENFKLATLIGWLLPKESILSAFTVVGHIVHLNLKESCIPYKSAIGTLLLDKVPAAKSIVSKVNKIDTEFRTFELELLAGEPNFVTTMKEHGVEFSLDFSKVYWNSRLSTEHQRICDSLTSADVVYDACAGIGPFAVPAAKKGCRVIANDLNGESVRWLNHNIVANSTKKRKIAIDVRNMDANDFIKEVVVADIARPQSASSPQTRFFLLMNLPSTAVNFLCSIPTSPHIATLSDSTAVLHVRCYCFIGKETPREAIEARIHEQLGSRVVRLVLRHVRNVAPNKDMFCAEVEVSLATVCGEVDSKRRRIGEA